MDNIDIGFGEHPCIKAQKILTAQQSLVAETMSSSICFECKRRKQKCTRYWPCHHCGKRKVSSKCIFQTALDVKSPEERRAQLKHLVAQMQGFCCYSHELLDPLDDDSDGSDVDLEELGYSTSHIASSYSGPRKKRRCVMPDSEKPGRSPHLMKALRVLPCRSCLHALVDNFLDFVNLHHSIVHPAIFRREYQKWCHRAYYDGNVDLQWTTLLLMVCACSAQYSSDALRHALEAHQDQSVHQLSEKYHVAGHELAMVIPVGRYDIHKLQIYLHSSLWFKTKARYPECWHDLTTAIQVACELDIDPEETASQLSEHPLEMVRRAWATICAEDWQLGSITSRPLILQPNLYDTIPLGFLSDGQQEKFGPSPDLVMSLQCELGSALSEAFGRQPLEQMKDIAKHRNIVESWAARLPPHLSLRNPDTSLDDNYPWLRFQRLNLTMIGTMSLLSPLRPYLTKPLSISSPAEDLRLQQDGTLWALRHLNRLFHFLRFAFPEDATYNAVLFFIFDVAALLCSAVIHDTDSSMPMRESALKAIDGSLGLMRTLKHHAPIAKQSYKILNHVCDDFLKLPTANDTHRTKRRRLELSQSQEFPNRRVEYMPELDKFWDDYDFNFIILDKSSSCAAPVFTDNGVGISTPAGVNVPPETSSNSVLADRLPTISQNSDENAEIDHALFYFIGPPNLEDQSAAITPPDALMHQNQVHARVG